MRRVDSLPTHEYKNFKMRVGKPLPFGSSIVPDGVNFSIFSRHAENCTLVLFEKHADEPFVEIPFPDEFRIGDVYTMVVFDLDYEDVEYGYRMDGPNNPEEGHWFNPDKILMDPYAKAIGGRDVWGEEPDWDDQYQHRARIVYDDFDWESDKPLETPIEDLIIYEMHVRGFTRHESSQVKYPGTFAAIKEKIDYLKNLGINCIELMPIFEFDEFEHSRPSPADEDELLMNYWGYSPVGFFAPKTGYAATGKYGMQVDELKNTIKLLHENDIEVILDVVFNHTAEGNEKGPYISFRGIDNQTYYILTPDGYYHNFSGCGNTLNCNNPIVRNMILDCLRYWAAEYHIDGFRFDLASIMGRDPFGAPMANPPLIETLAYDPILSKCKLIAEAWDAAGMYQVGSFPGFGKWAEWNGKYRDDIRKFLIGEPGLAEAIKYRIEGSPDLYGWMDMGTTASVNFITCHDGFTLKDLVSYNDKHNEANGENNTDGANDNYSWNCGEEGSTDDPEVKFLRQKQIKNALTILMLSQGIPMILSGDEMGNTQFGNNNAYCQDNEISWLNWNNLEKNQNIFDFAQNIINFRDNHPVLRNRYHLAHEDYEGSGIPDISWHGQEPWNPDFSHSSRKIAFMLCGKHAKSGFTEDNTIYVAFNMHWEMHGFGLPSPPENTEWHVVVNTDANPEESIWADGKEKSLDNQNEFLVGPRSVVVLLAK